MKKVELLAPAGNFDALKGVIKAGADAVYLGGTLYSARAYADNFTQDEICEGIRLAHVFGRKIYLTVNTLLKEKELDGLYQYILPFYEKGLDGAIVQDLGVLRFLRTFFPGLALHASTQMTITGSRGAALVKEEGISRVVPARELSLSEIKKIKEETGLEIEAFVHGAMCYCYSGQCLFSSILGGRSGNRGRCAQPCRLPYETGGKKGYPLSMRDMCTIELLPELIEAGIDSFKIEGRMKKPAYAAGVTAIYRKYIDMYYRQRERQRTGTWAQFPDETASDDLDTPPDYRVGGEDMDLLKSLYIRSEIGDGYYKRHNGREMISLHSPAYRETDEKLLADIEDRYIKNGLLQPVKAKIRLKAGEPARLTIADAGNENMQVTVTGDMVQKASRQPLTAEKILRQMQKSGESPLRAEKAEVEMEEPVFLPVSSLNELRRKALSAMEEVLIRQSGLSCGERKAVPFREPQFTKPKLTRQASAGQKPSDQKPLKGKEAYHALVRTPGQLEAVLEEGIRRVYLDYSLLEGEETGEGGLFARLSAAKSSWLRETGAEDEREFYLATPFIVREKDVKYLKKIENAFATGLFTGILIRNLESFLFFREAAGRGQMVLDANLYIWNREAAAFWEKRAGEFYLPVECNGHEWRDLLKRCPGNGMKASAIVYGRLPVMVTANCVKKTVGSCNRTSGVTMLKDRYRKQFPVYTDCLCCYNVIYNSVPLSLHSLLGAGEGLPIENFRLDFTTEEKREALQVIRYFKGLLVKEKDPFYKEYTTGHYKRGVD